MILHYFRKKENIDQDSATLIYAEIIDMVNFFFNNCEKSIEKNFLNTFYITSFFLMITFYISKSSKSSKDNKSKNISQFLMNDFINDIDHTLTLEGIGEMKIGKYVKFYVKKFYFYLGIFDKNVKKDNTLYLNDFFINNPVFKDFSIKLVDIEIIYKLIQKLISFLKKYQFSSSLYIK